MANRSAVETIVSQYLDESPDWPTIPADLLTAAVDALADELPDGDWGEVEYATIDARLTEAHGATIARADAIRHSCQHTGTATVGQLQIRFDTSFWDRARPEQSALAGWPASPHWWVELVTPDGEATHYEQGELSSWADLLTEAERVEAEWVESERRRLAGLRRRISDAAGAVAAAERALQAALRERDEAVAAGMAGGLNAPTAAEASGLSRARVYQLR